LHDISRSSSFLSGEISFATPKFNRKMCDRI
jgi:hypothetical protein